MTAINRDLAARVAELGVPLSADMAPHRKIADRAERRMEKCRKRGRADLVDLEFMKNDVLDLAAELDVVRADLARRTEDVAFLERATLPELRRTIQHHEDGKKRWRDRAREAEAMVDELKRPAELKRRGEIRQSLRELAAHCREGRDFESEASILQRLEAVEAKWARADEDKWAREDEEAAR